MMFEDYMKCEEEEIFIKCKYRELTESCTLGLQGPRRLKRPHSATAPQAVDGQQLVNPSKLKLLEFL